MVVYNDWSAYDELADNIPLSEELAMKELDNVIRLKKDEVRIDYYVMDAFWFDTDGGYRTETCYCPAIARPLLADARDVEPDTLIIIYARLTFESASGYCKKSHRLAGQLHSSALKYSLTKNSQKYGFKTRFS